MHAPGSGITVRKSVIYMERGLQNANFRATTSRHRNGDDPTISGQYTVFIYPSYLALKSPATAVLSLVRRGSVEAYHAAIKISLDCGLQVADLVKQLIEKCRAIYNFGPSIPTIHAAMKSDPLTMMVILEESIMGHEGWPISFTSYLLMIASQHRHLHLLTM